MAQVFQCAECGAHMSGAAWFPKSATDAMGRLLNHDYDGPHFCSEKCRDSESLDLSEMGTDELHELMNDQIQHLPGSHPVRTIWERLNEILRNGGPECLPAPWE